MSQQMQKTFPQSTRSSELSQCYLCILSPVTNTIKIQSQWCHIPSIWVTWPISLSLMGRLEVEVGRHHNIMFLFSDILKCLQEGQGFFLLANSRVCFPQQEGFRGLRCAQFPGSPFMQREISFRSLLQDMTLIYGPLNSACLGFPQVSYAFCQALSLMFSTAHPRA